MIWLTASPSRKVGQTGLPLAMAAYGLATALFVRVTAWGVEREPSLPSQRA